MMIDGVKSNILSGEYTLRVSFLVQAGAAAKPLAIKFESPQRHPEKLMCLNMNQAVS